MTLQLQTSKCQLADVIDMLEGLEMAKGKYLSAYEEVISQLQTETRCYSRCSVNVVVNSDCSNQMALPDLRINTQVEELYYVLQVDGMKSSFSRRAS